MEREGPIQFGVLGTGRITRKVGAAIARFPGSELAAVGSRDSQRAAEWAREFGAARSYGSYDDVLADEALDALYIALPTGLHAEWTKRAAARGLHVLCEKPLAANSTDAQAMVDACRRHGVQLMDGVMWIHTAARRAMRDVIASGAIGAPRRVTSAFTIHPDAWRSDEPRLNAELGGGCLLDLGWYCLGAALWVFGASPVGVQSIAEFERGVDVSTSALLRFPSGDDSLTRTAGIDCGFSTAMRKWLEIAGEEGSLVCDDFTRPRDPEKVRFWKHDRWGASEEIRCAGGSQEEDLIRAFTEPIRQGRVERGWENLSLSVQSVCDQILSTARAGEGA